MNDRLILAESWFGWVALAPHLWHPHLVLRRAWDALLELIWLRRAAAQARARELSTTHELERALAVSHQKESAADLLWHSGHRADGLRLAVEAAEWAARAVALAHPEREPEPPLPAGVVPAWDEELAPIAARWFDEARAAITRFQRIARGAWTPREVRHKRLWRVGGLLAVMVVATFWWLRPIPPAEASASASYSATYPPGNLLDGRYDTPATEWLLPEGSPGWAEVRLSRARTLSELRVKNASHPPHGTYGAKDFRIELFDGDELLETLSGRFDPPAAGSAWYTAGPFSGRVDRVRVWVDSHYGRGGGLAEIAWVE